MRQPHWLLVSLVLLGTAGTFALILAATGGSFVYPLDDSYIHLALVRNLVEHGNFGINPGETAFASSSILWSLILAAGYLLFGSALYLPLILNVAIGVAFVLLADRMLRDEDIPPGWRVPAVCLVMLALPLFPLLFTGMESLLHPLLVLAIFRLLPGRETRDGGKRTDVTILALLAVATLVRYETLFLAAALIAVSLVQRRWRFAALILPAVALPVLASGLVQLHGGGMFLPNTLLVKGHHIDWFSPAAWGSAAVEQLFHTLPFGRGRPLLLLLLILGIGMLIHRSPERRRFVPVIAVWTLALLQQVMFADVGRYFRYEAYLMASGMLLALILFGRFFLLRPDLRGRPLKRWLPVAAAVLLLLPVLRIGFFATVHIYRASADIHRQHMPLADFLDEHYRGEPVLLNDIGYVSYAADVRVIDLMGLGSTQVTRARYSGAFDTQYMAALAHREQAPIAAVYESWFSGAQALPSSWIPAGRWHAPRNYVLGDSVLTFFATDSASLPKLRRALADEPARLRHVPRLLHDWFESFESDDTPPAH